MRPALIARLEIQGQATHDAVVVDRQIDVTHPRCGRGQYGGGGVFAKGGVVQARRIHDDGQADLAVAGQGGGQGLILRRRLGEQDIIGDRPGVRLGQAIDQAGVQVARPGPLSQGLQTAVVDGDDEDVFVGRPGLGPHQDVIGQVVGPVGHGRQRQPADQQGG